MSKHVYTYIYLTGTYITQTEIDYERYALKILRGDFRGLLEHEAGHTRPAVAQILQSVQR
jgi:hypothetical protein